MEFQIELHNKTASLQRMESGWNELLEDSHANTIFLTWEWISTWWKVYGDKYELYIVTVKDSNGRLLAIAPLKIAQKRHFIFHKRTALKFIGYGEHVTPEYLDFIIRKGYEKPTTLCVLKHLLQYSKCDVFDFRPFVGDSKNIPFIKDFF